MPNVQIWVPDDLYNQLSDVVNWSEVACDAFKHYIAAGANSNFPSDLTTEQRSVLAVNSQYDNLTELANEFYLNSVRHGFFDEDSRQNNLHTTMLLWISEIIEMFKDDREGKAISEKIPDFTCNEEEAADLIIRVLSNAKHRRWRIAEAVAAKHAYNVNRPYKHGKKF